ncbi:MAG: hypothetical protein HY927_16675 [Elusimicrobia bacterium]|nr:hypothetical protein [Elusimicrobiota bacterium]
MTTKAPASERVKVRGLGRVAAAILAGWGGVVALKGLYDMFLGEPEANLYAAVRWSFVTEGQWLRYCGFELVYGLACAALAWAVLRYSRFLPETVERRREAPEFDVFG